MAACDSEQLDRIRKRGPGRFDRSQAEIPAQAGVRAAEGLSQPMRRNAAGTRRVGTSVHRYNCRRPGRRPRGVLAVLASSRAGPVAPSPALRHSRKSANSCWIPRCAGVSR